MKYILLISLLVFSSCRDTDVDVDDNEPEYEPGTVLIGFKPEVSLRDALGFLRSKNLAFTRIHTTVFVSALPPDSLSYVQTILSTKSYIEHNDEAGRIAFDGTIWVNPWFTKFDTESLNDWLDTCDQLKLSLKQNPDIASSTFTLKVIPGWEKQWVKALSVEPLVRWAELNTICRDCLLEEQTHF